MPCKDRDSVFTNAVTEFIGAKLSRCEAFTCVQTRICNKGERQLKNPLTATKEHLDGPNDGRIHFCHTRVFLFLCT